MSDPISIMRRFVHEYQTAGNEAVADELPGHRIYDHTFPDLGLPGRMWKPSSCAPAAFPDLRAEIVEQFADGDRVVTRKTFHGTHQGPFKG
jgi:predicted ester cyclase